MRLPTQCSVGPPFGAKTTIAVVQALNWTTVGVVLVKKQTLRF